MSFIRFESSWKKVDEREKLRSFRSKVLEDAQGMAMKRRSREEKEASWMLPELESGLAPCEGHRHKKKEKKRKKSHKEKKQKQKRENERRGNSSDGASRSDGEWEEKHQVKSYLTPVPVADVSTPSARDRDDWMEMEGLLSYKASTRKGMKDNREDAKLEERRETEAKAVKEKNKRELNRVVVHRADSFFINEDRKPSTSSNKTDGGGGASWLRRAFKRAQDQAKREGRSVEEIAAKRWGSIAKFEQLLSKAEGRTIDAPSQRCRVRDEGETRPSRGWKKMRQISTEPVKNQSKPSSSSSSRSSSPEDGVEMGKKTKGVNDQDGVTVLNDEEMNVLGAKLVKAELLENEELVKKLKMKLKKSRLAKERMVCKNDQIERCSREEVVVLTRTDSKGMTRPVDVEVSHSARAPMGKKRSRVETHEQGKRVRYFADDDRYDLKQMFEREKLSTAEDQNGMLSRLAGSSALRGRTDDDYDFDDIVTDKAASRRSEQAYRKLDRDRAVAEHRKLSRRLDDCKFCLGTDNLQKHLIVALGKKCYLCLPHHTPITDGHCFIVPTNHDPCGTLLDEDVHAEMLQFRRALTRMFEDDDDQDCVFFESALRLGKRPHMLVECIPLPREIGNESPMYFQKAIQECESEWSHNKKLIKLTNERGLRSSVPKGLPYFHVDFGTQNGFAHVVEDEEEFPKNFAREVLGGMLDLEPRLWRHPKRESFENQKQRVLRFGAKWKNFDFTRERKSKETSSSSSGDNAD